MDIAVVKAWIDGVYDNYDEYAYRHLYGAYLAACRPGPFDGTEAAMTVDTDGYHLRASPDGPGLHLRDDAEREEFVAYLVNRYCGDRYQDMEAWAVQQHAHYVDDLCDWTDS